MKELFRNTPVMTFYIISIVSMFIANFVREKNFTIYFGLIIFGLIFFILGLIKRFTRK